ncbi:MAG: response regulator [Acidobacteria bacterium]|nr:response regulator [Acidobacteriota bacterium]
MNKRILLADDSLTIQKVVELTFMDEDFEVDAVGSGGEAIERLEQELPSILIADIHMPGPSGYEVCRRAKEMSNDLPVLLLIGTFETLDEDEIVACGADGNLKKPFDSQELLQLVREMTAGAAPTVTSGAQGLEATAQAEAELPDDEAPAASEPAADDQAVSSVGFDLIREGLQGEPEVAPVDLAEEVAPETESFADETGGDDIEDSVEALIEKDASVFDSALEDESTPDDPEKPALSASDEPVEAAEEIGAEGGLGPEVGAPATGNGISDADVDRIARRVVELMAADTVREIAWDVIPDLAEVVIRDRIRQLEAEKTE